jgi:hypothetical protein
VRIDGCSPSSPLRQSSQSASTNNTQTAKLLSDLSIGIPDESIEHTLLLIHGQKVILDRNLARLYGVSTKALNQAVEWNVGRFPEDFMFQLTMDEASAALVQRPIAPVQGHKL